MQVFLGWMATGSTGTFVSLSSQCADWCARHCLHVCIHSVYYGVIIDLTNWYRNSLSRMVHCFSFTN